MTNPFEETEIDSENPPFIKHDFAEKTWYRGEEAIDVNYFMIDLSTLKTGWGIYTKEENYEYRFSKDLFTKIPRPPNKETKFTTTGEEKWKQAFSVWLLPKYIKGDKNLTLDPCLWQRFSVGEYQGFLNMGREFWDESQKPENKNKLPIVEWTHSETKKIGVGASCIPHFKLVKFQERPDAFTLMPEGLKEGEPVPESISEIKVEDQVEEHKQTLVDDEIPF